MAIARFPSLVLDCPDPAALATFYGSMLDWSVEVRPDWAEVRADYGQCICFHATDASNPLMPKMFIHLANSGQVVTQMQAKEWGRELRFLLICRNEFHGCD